MNPKVIHIIARMNVGGTASYVSGLVCNIPNNFLVTGHVQDGEIEADVLKLITFTRVPHLGRKISIFNDFRAWIELRELISKEAPDIVHTHTFKAGLLGRLISGKYKRVHTFHGHLLNDKSFSFFARRAILVTEKYLARKTDLLISVGEKMGVELRAAGIGTKNIWQSIPPGILVPQSIAQKNARKALGIKSKGIIFGWLARMTEVKNPFLLVQAATQHPSISFVMGGGGELLIEIKAAAPPNLEVIGWADMTNFWSAVDCAISTSISEGMPIALIEAQFSGKPIIATNVGSTSEVMLNGETGILVDLSLASLSAAIEKFASDLPLMDLMGKSARIYAERNFNMNNFVDSHRGIYLKLI